MYKQLGDFLYHSDESELYHYGVPGMKWGVRKAVQNANRSFVNASRSFGRTGAARAGVRVAQKVVGADIKTRRKIKSNIQKIKNRKSVIKSNGGKKVKEVNPKSTNRGKSSVDSILGRDRKDLLTYGVAGRAIKNKIEQQKTGTSTHQQAKEIRANQKAAKKTARNTPEAKEKRRQDMKDLAMYGVAGRAIKNKAEQRKNGTSTKKTVSESEAKRRQDRNDLLMYGVAGRAIKRKLKK